MGAVFEPRDLKGRVLELTPPLLTVPLLRGGVLARPLTAAAGRLYTPDQTVP